MMRIRKIGLGFQLLLVGALCVVAGVKAPAAQAAVLPYQLDANWGAVWDEITAAENYSSGKWFVVKDAFPVTTPGQLAVQAELDAAVGETLMGTATTVAPLATVSTAVGVVGAFLTGYGIGTVINNKWLHIQTRIAGPRVIAGNYHVSVTRWTKVIVQSCYGGGCTSEAIPYYIFGWSQTGAPGAGTFNQYTTMDGDQTAAAIRDAVILPELERVAATVGSVKQSLKVITEPVPHEIFVWTRQGDELFKGTYSIDSTAPTSPEVNAGRILQPAVGSEGQLEALKEIAAHPKLAQALNHSLEPQTFTTDPRDPANMPKFNMPDCVGVTAAMCEAEIVLLNGTAVTIELDVVGTEGAKLDLNPDTVVSTSPETGTELEIGTGHTIELQMNPAPEFMPFLVPEPGPAPGVTYEDYLLLFPVGMTFTRTNANETTGDPEKGPDTVLRTLPKPGTRVTPQTPITVITNPPDWPYPGGVIGPVGGCDCGAITFAPLTSVNFGEKFPFGVFTWVHGVFGTVGGGVAPSVTLHDTPGLGGAARTYSFSSNMWEDTIRGPVWLAIEFLGTLFAVWFLAYRIIGIGGDD